MTYPSHMASRFDEELVARIAKEVLRRLQNAAAASPPSSPSIARSRLVTLADVETLPEGSSLTIGPATVMTPAARDVLKERRIAIVRDDFEPARECGSVTTIRESDSNDPAKDDDLVAETSAAIGNGIKGALVLSSRPHRICAWLNAQPGIEAAVVSARAAEALEEPGFCPNVLVAPRFSPQALQRRWRTLLAHVATRGRSIE